MNTFFKRLCPILMLLLLCSVADANSVKKASASAKTSQSLGFAEIFEPYNPDLDYRLDRSLLEANATTAKSGNKTVRDVAAYAPPSQKTKAKAVRKPWKPESTEPKLPKVVERPNAKVDHVVVYKKNHQMVLIKNREVIRTYWIALSKNYEGHKVKKGDKRTPEGTYILDYVQPKSSYYKAFHISYPNEQDRRIARERKVNPGGSIMVHGQPPSKSEYHDSVQSSDWTNGCIAILNPEMDEFIKLVQPGTPITIYP